MKTLFPLRLIVIFFCLFLGTGATSLAEQKGFIGMQMDFKADPGAKSSVFNPTLMLGSVKYIVPKSPADGQNIKVGDSIIEIDGTPVLGCKLSAFKAKCAVSAGQTIHMKLKRPDGEIYNAEITAVPKTW